MRLRALGTQPSISAVREARQEPDLLVRETRVARGPERRDLPEPALERGALLDGARREPEPLVAVVLEIGEAGELPDPRAPDRVGAVAEQVVPGVALGGELPQPRVDLLRRGEVVEGGAGCGNARLRLEERPAVGLGLEPRLQGLQAAGVRLERVAGRPRAIVAGLDRVLRDVLLGHGLEPLRPRRAGQDPSRDRQGLVDRGARLGREPDAEPRPLVVVLVEAAVPLGPHRRLERADRLVARPLDPERLGVADGNREHRLRVPRTDLARQDRLAQQRTGAELPREPRHALCGPLLEAEDLPRVVPQARAAEGDEPVADRERREPLADREVERPRGASHLHEEPLDRVGVGLPAVDERSQLARRARLERKAGARRLRRRPDRVGLEDGEACSHSTGSSHGVLTLAVRGPGAAMLPGWREDDWLLVLETQPAELPR